MILRSNFLVTVPNVKSEKLDEKDMKAKRDGDLSISGLIGIPNLGNLQQ